jgi:hypothetical protein
MTSSLAESQLNIEDMANDADTSGFGQSQKPDPNSSLPADVDHFPLDGGRSGRKFDREG